jgi:hypothetical protein
LQQHRRFNFFGWRYAAYAFNPESNKRPACAKLYQVVVLQLCRHHAATIYHSAISRTQIAYYVLITALTYFGVMSRDAAVAVAKDDNVVGRATYANTLVH